MRIAIDDFGTGYSSLAHLQKFPVDALKIDRTFIARLTQDPEGETLIRTLVQLGKALSIETLAEGIEQSQELALLQDEQLRQRAGLPVRAPAGRVGAIECFFAQWLEREGSSRRHCRPLRWARNPCEFSGPMPSSWIDSAQIPQIAGKYACIETRLCGRRQYDRPRQTFARDEPQVGQDHRTSSPALGAQCRADLGSRDDRGSQSGSRQQRALHVVDRPRRRARRRPARRLASERRGRAPRAARALAPERRRVAADVHDLVMQDLSLALANARTLAQRARERGRGRTPW